MISVNTKSLGKRLGELNKILESYNEIHLNLFHLLEDSSNYWKDNNSLLFYEKINKERVKTEQIINNINSRKEIYNYLYHEYNEIGNSIKVNLDSREFNISKIDNCINKTNLILQKIHYIKNGGVDSEIREVLTIYSKRIKDMRGKYRVLKNKLNSIYNKIDIIEKNVNQKIGQLDFIKIEDFSL